MTRHKMNEESETYEIYYDKIGDFLDISIPK